MNRLSRQEVFMQMAVTMSRRASCTRRQVGALIVKENRVISTGYNGKPRGFISCEGQCPGCELSIHAEMNAIIYAAKAGISTEGAEMYTTTAPCLNCAKHILNSGIIRIIYLEDYRNSDGLELLEANGVEVRRQWI